MRMVGGGMSRFAVLAMLLLAGCASSRTAPDAILATSPMPPQPAAAAASAPVGSTVQLWATRYRVASADNVPDGVPFLTTSGAVLGAAEPRQWCDAALQGTVVLLGADGDRKTLNYAKVGPETLVDCSPYIAASRRGESWVSALGRTRWSVTDALYGLGVSNYHLVPYRTIAVDRTVIPIGSVVHIPAARGIAYSSDEGPQVHDGYFLAADVGGAVKGNHIDVFTGLGPHTVFPFVKSRADATFEATIVDDPAIKSRLMAMHR
jgi:3D (Asp-Asp-Asp) domain-containing protein